jgi:hypothetical protein
MQLSDPWSAVEVRQRVGSPRDDVFNELQERFRPPVKGEDEAQPDDDVALTIDEDAVAVETHGHREIVVEDHIGPLRSEVTFSLAKRNDDTTDIVMREKPLGPPGLLTPLLRPALALRNRRAMHDFARALERREAT